ncbi:coiled-coil domain-containing protein [Helicobacter pylori]
MDLVNLENALNNGDFKEQVYSSLEGIYQISKFLNQLEILDNFNEHDLKIVETIQKIKSKLASYETSEQELKAKINALVSAIEAKKQELEARLNLELQNQTTSEIAKLNEAGSALKNNLVNELTQAKNNLALELEKLKTSAKTLLNPMQGVSFVGFYVYGRQCFFKNESDEFRELFEFHNLSLQAAKSYIVGFSMPYELVTGGIYSESMGEMVLCLKANNKVYPIPNSFYQNKTAGLYSGKIIIDVYRINSLFKTPSEEAVYKITVFARKHKDLWVNVNYTSNTEGFQTSFLNNARFANLTTQSIPTDYDNDWMFHRHSQVLVYEIL